MMGVGQEEAPRGLLSHWVVIRDGRIANYQAVVPSTWLAAPKNDKEQLASYDAVSYTHLDVYKRQKHNWSHSSAIRTPADGSPFSVHCSAVHLVGLCSLPH